MVSDKKPPKKRVYTEEQKARKAAWGKADRAANPEKYKERESTAWAARSDESKKRKRERAKEAYWADPEKARAIALARLAARPPEKKKQAADRLRKAYWADPEKYRARSRADGVKYPERRRAATKAWRAANPNHRERKKASSGGAKERRRQREVIGLLARLESNPRFQSLAAEHKQNEQGAS